MRINTKGQVTIPKDIRNQLGLLSQTEVEFEMAGDHALIRKAKHTTPAGARVRRAVDALSGKADTHISTDEIMTLTRGKGSSRI